MRTRQLLASGVVAALAAGLLGWAATPASAAAVIDPERYSANPTGFGWWFSASRAAINDWADEHNMRITGIEVNGPDDFTAVAVHNSGVYQRGLSGSASWTVDETAESLGGKLADKRLLDLERYTVNGQTRFAAAWVDNPASNNHGYWWWLDSTESYIRDKMTEHNARIIDLDHVSGDRYDAIMIPNVGVDQRDSWALFGRTMTEITSSIGAHDARVVDIERHSDGKWSAVLVADEGDFQSEWHPNITAQEAADLQTNRGLRPVHLKPFAFNGGTRYSAIFVDNLDATSIRARDAIAEGVNGSSAVKRGFYLKRVDGNVLAALNPDTTFEPASMLKALHHVHAMRRVFLGSGELTDPVTWYRHSDPDLSDNGGVCAYTDNGTPIRTLPVNDTLGNTLRGMMERSDNRQTDAIYDRYGPTALNNTADALGMSRTQLNHRIGCTWEAPGQVKASNELTLADAGRLYEAVYRAGSPYLGTGAEQDAFTDLAATGLGIFSTVLQEEATALGLTTTQRNAFTAAWWGAYKPGGYANAAPDSTCDTTGCTALLLRTTGGGMIALPHRAADGTVTERRYVYGAFIDGEFDCGAGSNKDCDQESAATRPAVQAAMAETLRPYLRAALATWD